MKLTGAQIIAECLLEQKVDTVFGYPGGAVLFIYDALYAYRDKIRHILTAHEQGASHAADGYARSTGKTGVVIATSGPGATNLVTGIATAYMDSVPLVAITGNVATSLLGRDSFQEVDITGITMPVTKHNYIVKNIAQLADTIREAFLIAQSGRPGPVLIDVPKDVTSQEYDYTPLQPCMQTPNETALPCGLDEAIKMIDQSQRPLIYMGGGVISSGISSDLLSFAEKGDIPVSSSIMGLGGFDAFHPLYVGMIGMHGTYATAKSTQECDLLLVLGARFSDRVAGDRERFAKNAKIIHIDIDAAEIGKNVTPAVGVNGDLRSVLRQLTERIEAKTRPQWLTQINTWKKHGEDAQKPMPHQIIETVQSLLNPDDIIVTDVGQHQMWTAQTYRFRKPRTFLTSGGLGTMGYGLGAAIGAKIANPSRKVVLITGDGSFHMNLNELTTLASYDLPVTVVVMNNRVLGMVRQWQKLFYEHRFSHTDPCRKTDIPALAQAFGLTGMVIETPEQVLPVLSQALESNKPTVIDCRISKDDNVLPMIPPGGDADDMITTMD